MSVLDIKIPAWTERAACRDADPALFYPGEGQNGSEARAICRRCPVASTCLTFALDFESAHPGSRYGVFGGTTAYQRREIAAKRKASA